MQALSRPGRPSYLQAIIPCGRTAGRSPVGFYLKVWNLGLTGWKTCQDNRVWGASSVHAFGMYSWVGGDLSTLKFLHWLLPARFICLNLVISPLKSHIWPQIHIGYPNPYHQLPESAMQLSNTSSEESLNCAKEWLDICRQVHQRCNALISPGSILLNQLLDVGDLSRPLLLTT